MEEEGENGKESRPSSMVQSRSPQDTWTHQRVVDSCSHGGGGGHDLGRVLTAERDQDQHHHHSEVRQGNKQQGTQKESSGRKTRE